MRSPSLLAPLTLAALCAVLTACGPTADTGSDGLVVNPDDAHPVSWCPPQMEHFPVSAAHNIGYDHGSCGTGTCEISCPDAHANSDHGGDHHGIDVFAYQRAPLVAVASGQVVAVGTPSSTSGIRVRMRDACGWEYYYGHMDEAVVSVGDHVEPGQMLGYMGHTGTGSTHLHFNVSYGGDYSNDIDPFDLLRSTSATACDSGETWTEEETADEESDAGSSSSGSSDSSDSSGSSGSSGGTATQGECGWATGTTILRANQSIVSCDGRFTLLQQEDGNLVLYRNGSGALWHAGTHGNPGSAAAIQDDGNLVIYSASGNPIWWTGTDGHPGAILWVQDNGDVVLYDGWNVAWNSGTGWY
jgi:hypothetical protein